MARCTVALVGAWLRHDVDGVELAHFAQQALGRRGVEGGRVAPARYQAVPKWAIPVMVKICEGPASRTRTCCPPTSKWYLVAVALSMTTSNEEVGWWSTLSQLQLGEMRGLGSKESPRCRGRRRSISVCPQVRYELGVALDRSGGRLDTGDTEHLGQDRLRDRGCECVTTTVELGVSTDLEVDVLVDVAEQSGEGIVGLVEVKESPGDESDAEDDGDGGQGQAQLVGQQTLDGDSCSPIGPPGSADPLQHRIGCRPEQLVDNFPIGPEEDPIGVGSTAGIVGGP